MSVSPQSFAKVRPSSLWYTCPVCNARNPWHFDHVRRPHIHRDTATGLRYEPVHASRLSQCDQCRRTPLFLSFLFCQRSVLEAVKREHNLPFDVEGYLYEGRIAETGVQRSIQWCIIEERSRAGICIAHEIGPFTESETMRLSGKREIVEMMHFLNEQFGCHDLEPIEPIFERMRERLHGLRTGRPADTQPKTKEANFFTEVEKVLLTAAAAVVGITTVVRNLIGSVKDAGDIMERKGKKPAEREVSKQAVRAKDDYPDF